MSIMLAVGQDLHDPVCGGLDDLVVTGGEKQHARELDQAVVQGSDGLHVQMVGGLVEEQARWHRRSSVWLSIQRTFSPPESTFTFFTPSSPAKEHTAQEAADIGGILDLGEYWVSQSTMVSSLLNSWELSLGK